MRTQSEWNSPETFLEFVELGPGERNPVFLSTCAMSTYVSGATGSHSDRFVRQLEWDRRNPTNRGIRGPHCTPTPLTLHPPPRPPPGLVTQTSQATSPSFFSFINKFKLGFYHFQPNHLVFCFGLTIQLSGSYFPNQRFETRLPAVKAQES